MVEVHHARHADPAAPRPRRGFASLQHRFQIGGARQDPLQQIRELGRARFVESQELIGIDEAEQVEHHPLAIAHRLAPKDVHAEVGQHAADLREDARAVPGDDAELPHLVLSFEVDPYRIRLEIAGQHDVVVHPPGVDEPQIAPGQTVEEPRHLLLRDLRRPPGLQLGHALLARRNHLVAVAQRQVVVGVDVQAPQELFLPGREGLRGRALNVHQGQQAQHSEPFLGADQPRELPGHLRVLRVPPKRRLRHDEMVANQELHGAGRGRGDAEPSERSRDHAHALFRVVLVRPLADVVKQQREDDQLGLVQLGQRAREPPARRRARVEVGQVGQVADGHERMLVDRVLVVEVADDPAVYLAELGKHASEQPVLVHFRQPVVETGSGFQEMQEPLAFGLSREELLRRVAVAVPLDEREGVGSDRAAFVDGGLEHGEPRARLQRCAHGVDEARPVVPALDVAGDRDGRGRGRGRALEDMRQHPRHDAGVVEVDAHQRLDRPRLGARRAEAIGYRFLMLVAQDVLGALVVEMHHRADAQQELLGFVERLVAAARDEGHDAVGLRGGQRGQGADRGHVAQGAGSFLDVRLEVIDGVAVVPVAFRDQPAQRVDGRPGPR